MIQGLSSEIDRLEESNRYYQKGFIELHDRIDKAIEILGEWTIFETSACTDRIISKSLYTLKGVDKE